jgi:ketosteroid isomerase-like protein
MSEENIETLRRMFALFNARGVRATTEEFAHLLAPDFGLEEADEVPDSESFAGRDAFVANLAKLEDSFDELRMEPLEMVDLGTRIVVVVSMRGQGHGSGAPVDMTFAQLWSLRDGKVVSLRDYATRAEAIEAAGRLD